MYSKPASACICSGCSAKYDILVQELLGLRKVGEITLEEKKFNCLGYKKNTGYNHS